MWAAAELLGLGYFFPNIVVIGILVSAVLLGIGSLLEE